jgi:hypothetical protein
METGAQGPDRKKKKEKTESKRKEQKAEETESGIETDDEQYGEDEYTTMLVSMLQEFKVLVRGRWGSADEAFNHINRNKTGEITKGDLKITVTNLEMVLDKRSRHFIRNQIGKPCTREVWATFFGGRDEAYEMNRHAEKIVKRASMGQPQQPSRAPAGPVAYKSKFRPSMYEAPPEKDGYMEKRGQNGKYGMRYFIITGHYLTYYAVRSPISQQCIAVRNSFSLCRTMAVRD